MARSGEHQAIDAVERVAATGLLRPDDSVLVMLSGGADSVCLLGIARSLCARVEALHVNYGLRDQSAADEAHCRRLCERLAIVLHVRSVSLSQTGNLHDHARNTRYRLARELLGSRDLDCALSGHTADDQAETFLYRLAASPGRRSLRGVEADHGWLRRPLLGLAREQTREWCAEAGFEWCDDAANDDPRFARARVRNDLLPAFASLHPAALQNLLLTADQLRQEGELLDQLAADLADRLTDSAGRLALEPLAAEPASLAHLALRNYLERLGVPVGRIDAARFAQLTVAAARGGSSIVQLPGAEVYVEYGMLVPAIDDRQCAQAVALEPGRTVEFAGWSIASEIGRADSAARQPFAAAISPDRTGGLQVRPRRAGDRIDPVGMKGHKSLQDLFVDHKIPERLRAAYPTICDGDQVVWVPGLAVSRSGSAAHGRQALLISAHRPIGL